MQQPMPGGPRPGMGMPMPTPEQIAAMQRQIAMEAQKAGMTVPQYVEQLKRQAMAQQQARMQAMQQQQQQQGQQGQPGQPQQQHQHAHPHPHPHPHPHGPAPGQPQPITPGPPSPVALALAKWLRSQDLKPRTCILNGERKEMFRVKRALRALESPAYEKARKKNPALPAITDRASLENTFKLLPMSMLALRVSKIDDPAQKKAKRVKGLWTVKIEPQQEAKEDLYYAWLVDFSDWKRKVYAVLAVLVIFAIVLYPLWPLKMRQGVYYLSWGFLILLGLFFVMAIFRVILFCITYFAVPPGLWLFPNLWEDVSFLDSFKPVWAWHETTKKKKKKSKSGAASATAQSTFSAATGQPAPATATTTATSTQIATAVPTARNYVAPRVEELADGDEE